MARKSGILCVLGLMWAASCGPAFAFGPVNSGLSSTSSSNFSNVSFFARPFPHGYTGWGRCIRYVEVQGRWGWRLRRIRVCRGAGQDRTDF
jgi:hypothetical protein